MKKTNVSKICHIISLLLVLGFIIHTVVDYTRYNSTLNSAPFYIGIIINAVCFIVPAILTWLAGVVIKKRHNGKR